MMLFTWQKKIELHFLDAIKDLTDYQDEVGIMFEGFSALNAE